MALPKSQSILIPNIAGIFSAAKEDSIYKNFTLSKRLLLALASDIKYESIYGDIATDYYKEIKGIQVKENSQSLDKGRDYEYLILVFHPDLELFEAATLLKQLFEGRKDISYEFVHNGYFKVKMEDGYTFHFQLNRSTYTKFN